MGFCLLLSNVSTLFKCVCQSFFFKIWPIEKTVHGYQKKQILQKKMLLDFPKDFLSKIFSLSNVFKIVYKSNSFYSSLLLGSIMPNFKSYLKFSPSFLPKLKIIQGTRSTSGFCFSYLPNDSRLIDPWLLTLKFYRCRWISRVTFWPTEVVMKPSEVCLLWKNGRSALG
jgi:hypothetical protein